MGRARYIIASILAIILIVLGFVILNGLMIQPIENNIVSYDGMWMFMGCIIIAMAIFLCSGFLALIYIIMKTGRENNG